MPSLSRLIHPPSWSANRLAIPFLLVSIFSTRIATPVFAQNTPSSALINEALDKPITIELNDLLPAALRAIENKTSVPIRPDPSVWDLLPWGEQTTLKASIENQTLRQALAAITRKLGLTFVLADEQVTILPMPGLARLGRRSTLQELQTLERLASEPMPPVTGAGTVRAVISAIELRLEANKAPFSLDNRLDADTQNKVINIPRGATMMEALELIPKLTRGTWYPWSKTVILLSKESQVRDMLSKVISTRYDGVDVGQVLEDLRRRAGVNLEIEPGALQRVPADARSLKVFWDNVTIQQALESLKGITGIDYQVSDRGILISNPNPTPPAPAANDPVVAMVQLENGMTVLVRESQVPPELRAYLQARMKRSLEEVRQMAVTERFPLLPPPTTVTIKPGGSNPTTKPQ